MRAKPVVVIDILREIVAATTVKVLPELQAARDYIETINFVPGTPLEISDIVNTMEQQPSKENKAFPLFGVFIPIYEGKGTQLGIDGVERLRMCIAMWSNATDRTPTRYEGNFKEVLYPIYYEFLNQLSLDKRIMNRGSNSFKHTKIDWPYYNPDEEKNAFNKFVDAIEIRDLELLIELKHC